MAEEKANPYDPILQKVATNLQKLQASLKLKQQFFQDMSDVLFKESTTYQKCTSTRLRIQEQFQTLIRRCSHSEGFIYDQSRIQKIKQHFLLNFEELKGEILSLSTEVTRVKLEVQSFVAALNSYGKNVSAHQLLQLSSEKEKDPSNKEADIIDLHFRYFKDNSSHVFETEETRSKVSREPPRSTEASRFHTEEQLIAKLEASMSQAETWLLDQTEEKLQEIMNMNSTISQMEFKIAGKLDSAQTDPAVLQEEFKNIIEGIVKTDEYFYEKYLFAFGFFLSLEDRCMYLHRFILRGLVKEALENLLFASKGESYLQNLLHGIDRPGCLEPIEKFIEAYRSFIFSTVRANLKEYLAVENTPETSQISLAELLWPNYRKMLLASDSAKEKINLYLDSLKTERNKNWLCYSISTQYLPKVMNHICPLLMKIDEYR